MAKKLPETNHQYYNFDPVLFTLFDKSDAPCLRYDYYVNGAIRQDFALEKLELSGFDDALQNLDSRQFPIRLCLKVGVRSLHFTLKRIDRHGYIKGDFVVKVFGWLPVSWIRVNIRHVSLRRFVDDLVERIEQAV